MNKTLLKRALVALASALTLVTASIAGNGAQAAPSDMPVFVAQAGTASQQSVESVGDKLWTVGVQDDNAYVYDKTTLALEHTYPLPVCTGSTIRTSVDSKYLWVQCNAGQSIMRVDLSNGAATAINIGAASQDIYSDGTTVWVAAQMARAVYRVNATTGAVLGSTAIAASANYKGPGSLTSDGTHVWVSYEYGTKLVQLNATTGAIVGSPIDTGMGSTAQAYRLTHDATNLYAAGWHGMVQIRSLVDGTLSQTVTTASNLSDVGVAIPFDASLWVFGTGTSTQYQYDMSKFVNGVNPTSDGSFTTSSGIRNAITDGTNLYTADLGGVVKKWSVQPHSFIIVPSATPAPIVTPGVTTAAVVWTAPTTGTAPFTYQVVVSPAGPNCVVTDLTAACTGLVAGTSYTFAITASNSAGSATSPVSAAVLSVNPNADALPAEGDGFTPPASMPAGDGKTFTPTNDPTFQLGWDKTNGKLFSQATGIYTGYIEAKISFTANAVAYTCTAQFGVLKALPGKTAAQKAAAMVSKTFKGKQFCTDKTKLDPKTTSPKGGMTTANFKKIKSMNKSKAELAQEKAALAALKGFTGQVQIQVTRYRAWPTTMVNLGDFNSKGGKIPAAIRNTVVTLN